MSIEHLLVALEAQALDSRVELAVRCNPGCTIRMTKHLRLKRYRGSIHIPRQLRKNFPWRRYGLMAGRVVKEDVYWYSTDGGGAVCMHNGPEG